MSSFVEGEVVVGLVRAEEGDAPVGAEALGEHLSGVLADGGRCTWSGSEPADDERRSGREVRADTGLVQGREGLSARSRAAASRSR